MKSPKKGFIVPLLIIVVAVLVIVVGVILYTRKIKEQQGLAAVDAVAQVSSQTSCAKKGGRSDPKILVILAHFQDATPNKRSDSPTSIDSDFDKAGQYYNDNTNGTLSFNCGDVTVTPWVNVSTWFLGVESPKDQDDVAWMQKAVAAAVKSDKAYDPKNFNFVYVVSPKTNNYLDYSAITKINIGINDKSNSAILVNGPVDWSIYAHELGHVFNMGHYGYLTCNDGSDIETDLTKCSGGNYNQATLMGNGYTDFPFFQKLELNNALSSSLGPKNFGGDGASFLNDSNDLLVIKSGHYIISAIEKPSAGADDYKTIRLSDSTTPVTKDMFFIEYREAIGPDANGDTNKDVSIYNNSVWTSMKYTGKGFSSGTGLEERDDFDDQRPDSVNLKATGSISPGDVVFNDVPDNITVTVVSQRKDSITLDVELQKCYKATADLKKEDFKNDGNGNDITSISFNGGKSFPAGNYVLKYLSGTAYSDSNREVPDGIGDVITTVPTYWTDTYYANEKNVASKKSLPEGIFSQIMVETSINGNDAGGHLLINPKELPLPASEKAIAGFANFSGSFKLQSPSPLFLQTLLVASYGYLTNNGAPLFGYPTAGSQGAPTYEVCSE